MPGESVDVSGTPVRPQTETAYLVLHKPVGVVTTMRDPQRRRTIAEMLPRGRASCRSAGSITKPTACCCSRTTARSANRLLHPRYGVEKTYRATIAGRLSAANVKRFNDGVEHARIRAAGAKAARGCGAPGS